MPLPGTLPLVAQSTCSRSPSLPIEGSKGQAADAVRFRAALTAKKTLSLRETTCPSEKAQAHAVSCAIALRHCASRRTSDNLDSESLVR